MEVRFYSAANGRKPVADYMRSLDSVEIKTATNRMEDVLRAEGS